MVQVVVYRKRTWNAFLRALLHGYRVARAWQISVDGGEWVSRYPSSLTEKILRDQITFEYPDAAIMNDKVPPDDVVRVLRVLPGRASDKQV